ncbi:zinc ABC transporter substrate-binding protein [Bacillus sp. P14.5]|uniref:metal ABC transporter solute-binding protein, Zn/Mn family n=1 Tax=Bacillus sp. P14.5 TaxID=1983400 RepID=UPI000DE9095D|nr:zinc ABC transporter substrate-binding protein [Bacillus sp. P14.5]
MKRLKLLVSVTFLSLLAACGGTGTDNENTTDSDTLKVYTTVYPLSDFTEKIGGEYVETESIYPPGADEHTFEPSQKDMMMLSDADVFFYIGLGLEGFVDKAEDVLENENVTMVAAGAALEGSLEGEEEHSDELAHEDDEEHSDEHAHEEEGHSDEHAHEDEEEHSDEHAHKDDEEHSDEHAHEDDEEHSDEHAHEEEEGHSDEHAHEDEEEHSEEDGHNHDHDVDPHVWLDPVYSKELAHSIYEGLSEKMPEQEETFKENYDQLVSQLDELNESFEDTVSHAEHSQIFVAHAAYGYWEQRYGIEQVAISGISSTDEPSQQELKEIIDSARENNIEYILFEQNGSSRLTEVVQKEIGAEELFLHNLGVRTQEDIDEEKDYFDLMNDNIKTLQRALGSE